VQVVADRIEHVDDVLRVLHGSDRGDAERREVTGRVDRGAASLLDRRLRDDRIHQLPRRGFEQQAGRSAAGMPDDRAAGRVLTWCLPQSIAEHREHHVVHQNRVMVVLEADDRTIAACRQP